MTRLILGIVLTSIACYFFGFLYWGLNPLPYATWEQAPDDEAAGRALLEHFPKSGTYHIPSMNHDEETLSRLSEAGPNAFIHITREGQPIMQPDVMIKGFLLTLVTSALIALLLKAAGPAITSRGEAVKVAALAGLVAVVMADFGDSVWWNISWAWKFHMALYHLSSWVISGLILFGFVRESSST